MIDVKFGDILGCLSKIGSWGNPSLVDRHATYIPKEFCNVECFCLENDIISITCKLITPKLILALDGMCIKKACF